MTVATGKRLRARWEGDPPKVGEYLRSSVRPVYAYVIRGVRERRAYKLATARSLELVVDRVAADDVPADAIVHPWRWDPRRRGNAA